jgi:hypothetical protein
MTNKSILYPAIALIAAILLIIYLFTLPASTTPRELQATAPISDSSVPEARPITSVPSAVESVVPEPEAVEISEEKPILGQFMRVREIREHDGDGQLRNLEFVFREGILPQKLFPDNRQVIVKYDQLVRNMVGFGAATAYFYYEIVTHDTNGDGVFSWLDALTVAVSRPTGWEYRVLVRDVDEVLAYEDLPEEEALRLSLRIGGTELTQVYPLIVRQ